MVYFSMPMFCARLKTHRCFSKTSSNDFITRNSLSIIKVGSPLLCEKSRVCWISWPSKAKEDNAEKLNDFLCTAEACEVAWIIRKGWWRGWRQRNRMTKLTRQRCYSVYSLNDLEMWWEERDGKIRSIIMSLKSKVYKRQGDSWPQ